MHMQLMVKLIVDFLKDTVWWWSEEEEIEFQWGNLEEFMEAMMNEAGYSIVLMTQVHLSKDVKGDGLFWEGQVI